jgi:hypothetical protein
MKPFDLLAKQFLEVSKQYEHAIDNGKRRELLSVMRMILSEVDHLQKHLKELPIASLNLSEY